MKRYFWKRSVPYGDGFSTVGDEYFPEPGRDHHLMERVGDLAVLDLPDPPKEQAMPGQDQDKGAGPATHVQQEREAGDRGLVTTNPPVQDPEEAAAGVQNADHGGTGAPTRDDLEGLQERMRPFVEAAKDPARPLTADEMAEKGLVPASQPGEQAEQGRRHSPLDTQRADDPRPATPQAAAEDKATAETRDQVAADPAAGPFTADPSLPAPAGGGQAEDDKAKGGRKAKARGPKPDEPAAEEEGGDKPDC